MTGTDQHGAEGARGRNGDAAGLRSCDEEGKPHPLGPELLSAAEPVFASTVTGRPETVAWFLEAAHS